MMLRFVKKLNKMGKINVCGCEGVDFEFVSNAGEEVVCTVDIGKVSSLTKFLNFGKLFADTKHKFGYVFDRDGVIFDDGSVGSLKDVFSKLKVDKRVSKPKKHTFVELQKCFNGDAFLTIDSARKIDSGITVGYVTHVNRAKGHYDVSFNKEVVRLPSVCLKRINKPIMSKDVAKVYELMAKESVSSVVSPEYNYMSISECCKFIEYISKDRLDRFNGSFWDVNLRSKYATKKKIRGVIGSLFNCGPEIVEQVLSVVCPVSVVVDKVSGSDICDIFRKELNTESGTLGNSCMLGQSNRFFELYEDNAEAIVIKSDITGLIVARAIVWNLVHNTNPRKKIKLVDRIYTSNTTLETSVKVWAKANGYHTLESQQHSQKQAVSPKGKAVDLSNYHVPLKKDSYSKYPYIDTFHVYTPGRLFCYAESAHSTHGDLTDF